jgi:hypothetical protein
LCIQTVRHHLRGRRRSGFGRFRFRGAGRSGQCRRRGCRRFRPDAASSSWPSIRCASRGGRGPRGCPSRAVVFRGLPQHEVHGSSCRADVDARARLHLVQLAARQLAVVRPWRARRTAHGHRSHRHGPLAIRRSMMAIICSDVLGGARLHGGRQAAERRDIGWNWAPVLSVTLRIASFSGHSGKSRAARR